MGAGSILTGLAEEMIGLSTYAQARITYERERLRLFVHHRTDLIAVLLLADFKRSTSLNVRERYSPGGTSSVSGP